MWLLWCYNKSLPRAITTCAIFFLSHNASNMTIYTRIALSHLECSDDWKLRCCMQTPGISIKIGTKVIEYVLIVWNFVYLIDHSVRVKHHVNAKRIRRRRRRSRSRNITSTCTYIFVSIRPLVYTKSIRVSYARATHSLFTAIIIAVTHINILSMGTGAGPHTLHRFNFARTSKRSANFRPAEYIRFILFFFHGELWYFVVVIHWVLVSYRPTA